ncbi:MAG: sulfotransferase domain-containing protein [Gammaproteobacteria bacterium]|nr:sulfotransferase domain-containing protein [Gammaproteobacteria bacterium]MCW8928271.1 sulfotransferase domain-containing protein [Gammaproteobacteria bacterium]MCW8959520.1 sulfotransferase domain-containing protein [Gammaproteobacteria bacterium]MCW8971758.1 sulfotransferase domain-containing protein [Gammaproteobacteria bacterium]MCW8993337.1 sulfotransferase domain-containing protein [Gammaproteobacteria bacterium]
MKNIISKLRHKYRLLTAERRPLPDFIIIGAQKAGTTSLFKYLSMHHALQPSITTKELHFFDSNYDKGEKWYRSNFPVVEENTLCYEASPSYLLHPCVPERAAAMLPEAKLIVLLRNPVYRAYSSYQHQVRAGRETLSFEEALAQEELRVAEEKERLLHDPAFIAKKFRHFSYAERGMYVQQIKRWLNYFSREQMLILESEQFWQSPETTFSRIFEFLGVESISLPVKKKYNTGNYSKGMDPQTHEQLVKLYQPFNEELFDYLGERFDWE